MVRNSVLASVLISSLPAIIVAADFSQCRLKIVNQLTENGTVPFDPTGFVPGSDGANLIYQGPTRGYRPDAAPYQPLRLTPQGCREKCGDSPDYYDTYKVIQTLTTWVLPILAILGQLPYEALTIGKLKNIEAFLNWIGSPGAALTTTIWNMRMIMECAQLSRSSGDVVRNNMYILSCINQYQYPRHKTSFRCRDQALVRGILFPFVPRVPADGNLYNELLRLSKLLAFHLRLQRRKAVYPLSLNILLFFAAFIISVVLAFAQLGDNTTAHSLALGLLLSWMPVIAVASITDRNPLSSARCRVLIQRWLYEVDAQFAQANGQISPERTDAEIEQIFSIGEFVGQGRILRYCGVTDTVMDMINNPDQHLTTVQLRAFFSDQEAQNFRTRLANRPREWYIIWFLSQLVIAVPFSTAFAVSFMTPTIGLGCRSLSYVIWYLLSTCSSLILLMFHEPKLTRSCSCIPNTMAIFTLIAIIAAQVSGLFNNCVCKSSTFGSQAFGGYMDFENGEFYHKAYNVQLVWGLAAAAGFITSFVVIIWCYRRWNRDSELWRVVENADMEQGGDTSWLR